MPFILAVDQSTSATKALLFTATGELLDKVALPHQQFYPQPGWVEHDAEEIYRNVLAALDALLARHPDARHEAICLSLTNQRETFVIFDRITGRPLHRAIVWQCRRGDAVCAELNAAGHAARVQRRTGLKIDTYFPAPKLKWLLDHEPAIADALRRGDARFGTIDTYLIYRLTGGRSFRSDHTNASRTLLYDIGRLAWDEELCALFGAPVGSLPEVVESGAIFGETDLAGRLPRPIPICGVMGDSQAALFAERCFTPGEGKATFGTGTSILLNIGGRLRLSAGGTVTTIGWVHGGRPTYAFEGIINATGATIAWLCDQLRLIETPAETEMLAVSVPDNGGVYLVPAFVGLSAPYWRSDVTAAITGLTPASGKAHVARAALESIAYQIRDALDLMGQEAGVALRELNADGGMVRNRFLMQFTADITGVTVRAARVPELSALGAAFAGTLGMGIYRSLDDLTALPHAADCYTPAMPPAAVARYYAGWQDAVARVLYKPRS